MHFTFDVKVRFFRDAVRVLLVSRRTLTYTFVFAYFLRKNNQVEIFEDNQSDLESAVERLSGYMEQEMTPKNVVALKRNIQESFKWENFMQLINFGSFSHSIVSDTVNSDAMCWWTIFVKLKRRGSGKWINQKTLHFSIFLQFLAKTTWAMNHVMILCDDIDKMGNNAFD